MAHALNVSRELLTRQASIISLPGLGLPPGRMVVEIDGDVESIRSVVVRMVAGACVDAGMVAGALVAGRVEEVSPIGIVVEPCRAVVDAVVEAIVAVVPTTAV